MIGVSKETIHVNVKAREVICYISDGGKDKKICWKDRFLIQIAILIKTLRKSSRASHKMMEGKKGGR